jgi:alpha-amylase/alpha-mannosidase (GH57 family)
MKKLKIAFLWHHHQPFYKLNGEYLLPWARLHGIKDYLDLSLILYDYPKIKQTFNLVPSLLKQLLDYKNDTANEIVLNLTKKRSDELSFADKSNIIKSFFICNYENMIKPHERFRELYEKSTMSNINEFTIRDWLDLQVWYNLTWFGPISRQRSEIKYLLAKGRDYTEDDKKLMLVAQREIINEIIPTFKRLMDMGQIEVSVSPFNHPILPLLIDSKSAHDSMPNIELPETIFNFPQDAAAQIETAVEYYKQLFDRKPQGMWPSEGSVSNEALKLMSNAGINWVATDEMIIMNSIGEGHDRLERFFPRVFNGGVEILHMFFREHFMSDLIGFQYSSWDADKASEDFINRLKYVRWELTSTYGEECLDSAVVSIIMDGENCWEFYEDNGIDFLKALYSRLSNDDELTTVTFQEAINNYKEFAEPFSSIKAGSWIDGNFDIWIGQEEHRKAWSALSKARKLIDEKRGCLNESAILEAMNIMYVAEASDWFWWYSDSHQAPNKYDFDYMFREHLKNIYRLMDSKPPEELEQPFAGCNSTVLFRNPTGMINPEIYRNDASEWEGAGFFNARMTMDSMHSGGLKINKILIGNNEEKMYFRLELSQNLRDDDRIVIDFPDKIIDTMTIDRESIRNISNAFIIDDILQLSLSAPKEQDFLKFRIIAKSKYGITIYPRQGEINIILFR